MTPNINSFVEKIDNSGLIAKYKERERKMTDYYLAWSKKIDSSKSKKFSHLSERRFLANSITSEISQVSREIKVSIERVLDSKVSYEIFSRVIRHYGLDVFLTKEVSKATLKEKEDSNNLRIYDNLNKKTTEEVELIIREFEHKYILASDAEKIYLTRAKEVLKKKSKKISNQIAIEFQEFRDKCLLKSSSELRGIVFDDSGDISDDQKKIARHILKRRHTQ